jgi:hypothetical protein
MRKGVLLSRLEKGMSIEEALQAPVRKRSGPVAYSGETLTITEIAKRHGINKKTLFDRLYRGMSIEEALQTPVKK